MRERSPTNPLAKQPEVIMLNVYWPRCYLYERAIAADERDKSLRLRTPHGPRLVQRLAAFR